MTTYDKLSNSTTVRFIKDATISLGIYDKRTPERIISVLQHAGVLGAGKNARQYYYHWYSTNWRTLGLPDPSLKYLTIAERYAREGTPLNTMSLKEYQERFGPIAMTSDLLLCYINI